MSPAERGIGVRPVLVRLPGGWGLFVTVPPSENGALGQAYRTVHERGSSAVSATGSWSLDEARHQATLLLAFGRPRTFDLTLRFSLTEPETERALRTIGGISGSHVAVLFPARADHARAMRAVDRGDAAGFLRAGIAIDSLDGTPLRPLLNAR